MNAWQSKIIENGGNTDTITTTFSNVGIGTNNPTKRLDVVGNIAATTTITAGQSISAPKIYGEGTTPVGGIIMWSGAITDIPLGWALCDGEIPVNQTVATPNLKGRFIVGYDAADTDYNATNKVGPVYTDADGASTGTNTTDAKQVRLTGEQSGLVAHNHNLIDPKHSHGFNYESPPNDDDLGGGKKSAVSHNITKDGTTSEASTGIKIDPVASTSANQPIENRPPYYVLAYIIKLAY